MNVLLISSNYAPERGGIAIYSTGLAEGLVERGHRVEVIAAFPHYPEWSSAGRKLRSTETQVGVRVRRCFHYVPRAPTLMRRSLFEAGLVASHLASLPRTRPDVIVGVVPTLAGGLVARMASRIYRRPYGVIMQDLMGRAAEQVGVRGSRSPASLIARVEGYAVGAAAGVAIVAEGFHPYLVERGIAPDRIMRVWNWGAYVAPTTDRATTRAKLGWSQGETVCLYAGSMGFKHALETLVDAAPLLADQPVRFVLAGAGSERSALELRSNSGGGRVEFLPTSAPGDYEALLEAADLLLLSQRGAVSDMSVASKVRSYRRAGRPIVAALPESSDTRRELEAVGGGIIVPAEKPTLLAEAIRDWLHEEPRRVLDDGCAVQANEPLDRARAVDGYEDFLARCFRSAS